MGILSISELTADRSAEWSVRGGRNYTVTLDVLTDDQTIGPRAVILALKLTPGQSYRFPMTTTATEWDPASFLQSVRVDTVEEGLQHRVTLSFGPYDASIEGAAQGSQVDQWIMSPTDAPPTVRWSSASEDFSLTHDRDGNPILNTAGDPFDPPIQVPVSTPVANVTRVLKAFDPAWISYFKDSVNEAEWLGWPAESVLVQEITGDKYYDPDHGWLWTVTYQFAFRPSIVSDDGLDTLIEPGWSAQVLNAGLRCLKTPDVGPPALKQIIIDDAPISSPVGLDEDGAQAAAGADPIYLKFNVRRTADFSLLDLPDDLFSASTP